MIFLLLLVKIKLLIILVKIGLENIKERAKLKNENKDIKKIAKKMDKIYDIIKKNNNNDNN